MQNSSKLHYGKKEFYRRKLPHFQNLGALFFVTFNVKSALKISEKEKLRYKFENSYCIMSNHVHAVLRVFEND